MTVRASEIGSEGKALIEDQKKGSRGLSCQGGKERREGREGPDINRSRYSSWLN